MISELKPKTERRQLPRFVLKQSLDIVLENGDHINVESRNISSSGLQIQCDGWVTAEIEPRGIQSHSINHLHLKVVMPVSIQDETKKIYANCRVISVHRQSQDDYLLSLKFTDFENGSESVLKTFLEQFQEVKVVHKGVIADNSL